MNTRAVKGRPNLKCPFCGSEDVWPENEEGDEGDKDYTYYVCDDCDSEFDQREV